MGSAEPDRALSLSPCPRSASPWASPGTWGKKDFSPRPAPSSRGAPRSRPLARVFGGKLRASKNTPPTPSPAEKTKHRHIYARGKKEKKAKKKKETGKKNHKNKPTQARRQKVKTAKLQTLGPLRPDLPPLGRGRGAVRTGRQLRRGLPKLFISRCRSER